MPEDFLVNRSRFLLVFVTAVALAGGLASFQSGAAAQAPAGPKLVVILAVDQLRTDYLQRHASVFKGGFHRLTREGAWFTEGAYPYLSTVTCAGHATIGTGTLPYRHGMVLNAWYDRQLGRSRYCVEDPGARDISYSGLEPAPLGSSARAMLTRALGETLHGRGGRSVSLSLKSRSSIPLAGRRADAVVWFEDRGGWSTSNAYTSRPVPFLQAFFEANPLEADFDKVWERTLDPDAYEGEDDAAGEGSGGGWTRAFPHPLGSPGGKPDALFYSRWQRSPFADEYLGRMAVAAVDALQLGRGKGTDFLAVSFSALDSVGHAYGPGSHEVQDMVIRLDLTIGSLLQHLDERVGAGNYVLGLSADHGVAEIPEQSGGGRQSGRQVTETLAKILEPVLPGTDHVRAVAYTDIYLSSAARERVRRDRNLMNAMLEALRQLPGTAAAFSATEVAAAKSRASADPILRAAAFSYHPERSGDLIIVPKENWLFSTSITTHGTHHGYDQRVPVIVFGPGLRGGQYREAATPADIAPTLAAIVGVRLGRTDGRVLSEAFAGGQ